MVSQDQQQRVCYVVLQSRLHQACQHMIQDLYDRSWTEYFLKQLIPTANMHHKLVGVLHLTNKHCNSCSFAQTDFSDILDSSTWPMEAAKINKNDTNLQSYVQQNNQLVLLCTSVSSLNHLLFKSAADRKPCQAIFLKLNPVGGPMTAFRHHTYITPHCDTQ